MGGVSAACILPFAFLPGAIRNPRFALPAVVVIVILLITLSIKFSMWFYFVVDKRLGPVNALKASSRATMGAKFSLFVFGILCGLINILGMLCFLVGLFATIPTVMLAMAFVYRQLSEQTPELAELGIEGPRVEPGASAGGVQSIGGSQFASIIQSVINARPDQDIQSKGGIRPAGSSQPAADVQPSPALATQRKREEKSNKSLAFWLNILIVSIMILAAGVLYRLWPRMEVEVAVPPNEDVKVTPKEVSLTGILYSEGNSSAIIYGEIKKEGDIINGTKIIKIHKDEVEFEKDGVRWTQRAK
jgi:hypothetical protein